MFLQGNVNLGEDFRIVTVDSEVTHLGDAQIITKREICEGRKKVFFIRPRTV